MDSTISGLYFPIVPNHRADLYRAISNWTVSSSMIPITPHIHLSFSLSLFLPLFHSYAAHSYASSRLLAATRVHFTRVPAVYQPLPTSHISDGPMWSLSREAARRAGHRYTTWHKNKGPHTRLRALYRQHIQSSFRESFFFVYGREWAGGVEYFFKVLSSLK